MQRKPYENSVRNKEILYPAQKYIYVNIIIVLLFNNVVRVSIYSIYAMDIVYTYNILTACKQQNM